MSGHSPMCSVPISWAPTLLWASLASSTEHSESRGLLTFQTGLPVLGLILLPCCLWVPGHPLVLKIN